MSKRNTGWDEGKIERYFREGRGQGEGKDYKPWLTIQDVPSTGRVSRVKGWKTGRLHHLMSDHEKRYFFLLEWADNVLDIREQYPLDREKTISIAQRKLIKHPVDRQTKTPLVFTTDFLITLRNQKNTIYLARTIKPHEELEKPRTLEKLEVEQAYWQEQGIDWGIVTDLDIPKILAANVEWIHPFKWLDGLTDIKDAEVNDLLEVLIKSIPREECTLQTLVSRLNREFNLENGVFLNLAKYLMAHKILRTDFENRKVTPRIYLKDFSLYSNAFRDQEKVIGNAVS